MKVTMMETSEELQGEANVSLPHCLTEWLAVFENFRKGLAKSTPQKESDALGMGGVANVSGLRLYEHALFWLKFKCVKTCPEVHSTL